MRCGDTSPGGHVCILSPGGHLAHVSADGAQWPNERAREARERAPKKISGSRARRDVQRDLRAMATRTTPFARVNPINDAPERVDPAQWATTAEQTLHRLLMTRREPFTTPEVLWPLLDSPPTDMRSLSTIVQAALRQGKMAEVGFVRLRDTYRTRDGVSFEANKVVPRYQSRIFAGG